MSHTSVWKYCQERLHRVWRMAHAKVHAEWDQLLWLSNGHYTCGSCMPAITARHNAHVSTAAPASQLFLSYSVVDRHKPLPCLEGSGKPPVGKH